MNLGYNYELRSPIYADKFKLGVWTNPQGHWDHATDYNFNRGFLNTRNVLNPAMTYYPTYHPLVD
jgi:hypothetical protein